VLLNKFLAAGDLDPLARHIAFARPATGDIATLNRIKSIFPPLNDGAGKRMLE
jgi:hypothetical protein